MTQKMSPIIICIENQKKKRKIILSMKDTKMKKFKDIKVSFYLLNYMQSYC